jgi:D-glycero-beta-D-manno-heptose 1-phosphate adenylyltransferase
MAISAPMKWSEASQSKIIAPHLLSEHIALLKSNNKTIVTLNGSFDLMHAGHLQIIYEASLQGEVLIVALNSDASIKKYKSLNRPIIPLEYRMEMMAALEFVRYVTWFDETDPRQLLSTIQPHVHVNGEEYGENCLEADVVRSYGGKMHIVSIVPGFSTSTIIHKIQREL